MSAVQVRVQYKNVCYISNLVGPKAHNTIHVNTKKNKLSRSYTAVFEALK